MAAAMLPLSWLSLAVRGWWFRSETLSCQRNGCCDATTELTILSCAWVVVQIWNLVLSTESLLWSYQRMNHPLVCTAGDSGLKLCEAKVQRRLIICMSPSFALVGSVTLPVSYPSFGVHDRWFRFETLWHPLNRRRDATSELTILWCAWQVIQVWNLVRPKFKEGQSFV